MVLEAVKGAAAERLSVRAHERTAMLGHLLLTASLLLGQMFNPQLTVPKGAQEAAEHYFENEWKLRRAGKPGFKGDIAEITVSSATLEEAFISHGGTGEGFDVYVHSPIADPRYFTTKVFYIFPIFEQQTEVSSLTIIKNEDENGVKLKKTEGDFIVVNRSRIGYPDIVRLRARFKPADGYVISRFYFSDGGVDSYLVADKEGKLFAIQRTGETVPIEEAAADWKAEYLTREFQKQRLR